MRMVFLLASVATAFIGGSPAYAEWPDRPIKMIVPFSAGSSSDTMLGVNATLASRRTRVCAGGSAFVSVGTDR